MIDYLIVGQGIAGSCFALKLIEENNSFIMVDADKNKASSVAVGIYNPVVLKRFSLIWNAEEQLKLMRRYFSSFETLLNAGFIEEIPTFRILKNEDEIRTWKKKAAMPELKPFLSEKIMYVQNENIRAPFGYAEVKQTGRIDLGKCLSLFKEYLTGRQLFINDFFDYTALKIQEDQIQYKEITARKIVFCEGFGITNNPYFNHLPVIGVKGEVLKIKTETEITKAIWKAHNFLMPVGKNECLTASTYDRDDLTPVPTEKGKREIRQHLEEIYSGKYETLEHSAGIRPTILDRRPVLGNHHQHKNLYVLNGMGTRGTLLAPQMTEFLYGFIKSGKPIHKEADVRRFDHFRK